MPIWETYGQSTNMQNAWESLLMSSWESMLWVIYLTREYAHTGVILSTDRDYVRLWVVLRSSSISKITEIIVKDRYD